MVGKVKVKGTLAGPKSKQQLEENSPTFYFYFEENPNSTRDSWYFATASSPNEFVLVKLDDNKNSREIVLGSEGYYKSKMGVPDKDKVAFEFENIADGIFKVSFTKPLKKGEYCFIYASTAPTSYSNDKVFDFGIQNEN